MNKILLILLLLFSNSFSFSQKIIKWKSTHVSIVENGEWIKPEPCNLLIVMDFDNLKMKIYSDIPQAYDIVDIDTDYLQKGITKMLAVDSSGKELELAVQQDGDSFYIMVFYPNKKWGYICKKD